MSCSNNNCPQKEECSRYKARVNSNLQYYTSKISPNKCYRDFQSISIITPKKYLIKVAEEKDFFK